MVTLREQIIPTNILRELQALGVVVHQEEQTKHKAKPDYKFQMPNLDENGEPDF